ncbi:armadillo-type protein, partial [Baffinella frigidus]
MAPSGGGLFVDHKKGEIPELKAALRDPAVAKNPKQQRATMEKVVGYMTLGIDMSPLFSEMIMATATKDLVLKKMCYLYLSNYAEQQPELALLVINTLQKDASDEDPMVRGLALRCICTLCVNNILEYIIEPVAKGLRDASPYVRKTAVMCVLRLRDLSPETVVERRLVPQIVNLIDDRDPQVVANSMYALQELQGTAGLNMLLQRGTVTKLLKRLREFNEWSQCQVLQVIADFQAESDEEVYEVMDFLDERLRHGNSAVVLGTVKVFLNLTADKPGVRRQVAERIKGPVMNLVTGGSPEVASVLLAHILLLAQECDGVFEDEYDSLFVRYSDPAYVQALKIQALSAVASGSNFRAIVNELSSLVSAFDNTLSASAIQALGEVALRLPAAASLAAEKLVSHLAASLAAEKLVSNLGKGVPAVTRESVVVARNLMRRHRQLAPMLLPSLTAAIRSGEADQGEAKAALVWVLGEFGEGDASIPEAPYLLEPMIDEWGEETDPNVKAELLTAAMKLFFARPGEMQQMLGRLLKSATADTSDVDVHDRALFYYRLLMADPNEAKAVVLGAGTSVDKFDEEGGEDLKESLFSTFGTLSVVYNMPEDRWLSEEALTARDN